MLMITALFALVACAFASPLREGGRIINGSDADIAYFPYLVSLRYRGAHNCGASILDSTHILTAAHCVAGSLPSEQSVQYGRTIIDNETEGVIQVDKINFHADYDPWNHFFNDIAVLTLHEELPLGELVEPATLPQQGEDIPAGKTAALAGWGDMVNNGGTVTQLQAVDLLVYTDKNCTDAYGESVDKRYQLCASVPEGGKGQCNGDSGGPLYSEGKQIGVVSWSSKPCALKGYPGVFARVANYIDWINESTK